MQLTLRHDLAFVTATLTYRIEPAAITQLAEDGIRNGQAGRFADAEWCFVRIVWNWPGYLGGHLNLAEALRDLLHRSQLDAIRSAGASCCE